MRKSEPIQWVFRVLIYVLGLFFMAIGVAISVNASLGISPVNSLPYVISRISGFALSSCVIGVFTVYILAQIVLLRREFKWINLTQLIFSTIFGYFVDFAKWLLADFYIPTYAGRLVMLAISIVVVSVGVELYLEVELVPMPMEGMTLALAQVLKKPFPSVKIAVDCTVVLLGLALSLVFLHQLDGVREGTIIAAVVTGKIIALVRKPLSPLVRRVCFGGVPAEADQ